MGEWIACEQNERISEWMSLFLDGLLDADRERRMEQHLNACAACRAEWQAMQRIAVLFAESAIMGPPLGFAVRVERRLAERVRERRRLFGGTAVLTGSLSLAGVAVAAVGMVVLSVVAWQWIGSFPAMQQGSSAVSQIASGVGLMGKGASLFLKDLLLRYGVPVLLLAGVGLTVLAGLWAWMFCNRRDRSRHNGYA